MTTYIVSYDLNAPGQQYKPLIEYLESLPNWWHHLDSTWVVVTPLSPAELRDTIGAFLDANDELLVVKSAGVGAWRGFADRASQWLKSNL